MELQGELCHNPPQVPNGDPTLPGEGKWIGFAEGPTGIPAGLRVTSAGSRGSQWDSGDPSRTQDDPSRTHRIPAAPWDPSNYKGPLFPIAGLCCPPMRSWGWIPLISPSPAAP